MTKKQISSKAVLVAQLLLGVSLVLSYAVDPDNNIIKSTRRPVVIEKGVEWEKKASKTQYTPHEPVTINGNADFDTRASEEGWMGTGKVNDPYIIEGYNISSSQHGLIVINNTTSYFKIGDCYLICGKFGIYLDNVTNACISSNYISGNGNSGILLQNSAGNRIIENNISSNWVSGIKHLHSLNNSFIKNAITGNNVQGILNFYSNESLFQGNNVVNNWEGIDIAVSESNKFAANTISGSIYDGFDILESTKNIFLNNEIINNNGSAIVVLDSNNNTFESNYIANTHSFGMELTGSGNNTVTWNDFINNRRDFPQYDYGQAYDGLNEGENNTFDYNHWDDWITPDNDSDGIVDEPYVISGDSNSIDPHPRVTVHMLTAPEIYYPDGGETLAGTVSISWEASSDSLEHEVSYTVYYSDDSGSSWYQLGTGIAGSTCNWNTLEVVDGNTYRVKVVATCTAGWTAEDVTEGDFTVDNSSTTSSTESTGTSTVTGYLLAAALVSLFVVVHVKKR